MDLRAKFRGFFVAVGPSGGPTGTVSVGRQGSFQAEMRGGRAELKIFRNFVRFREGRESREGCEVGEVATVAKIAKLVRT